MLNINYENVKNHKTVCLRPEGEADPISGVLTPATFALGFSMGLNLGVAEITEENLDDVWERVYAWDRIIGPLRTDPAGNPVNFTFEEVKAHVGLKANTAPLSSTKFWRKVRDAVSTLAASAK